MCEHAAPFSVRGAYPASPESDARAGNPFRGPDLKDAKALKGARCDLLKHPARLKPGETRRLGKLRRANRALDRTCEPKEYLATIPGQATPDEAPELLEEWLDWAARSRLEPFVKPGRTIRKHAESILAYLDTRMTNDPAGDCAARVRLMVAQEAGKGAGGGGAC